MIRKILTIFSLLALLSSMWLRWECQYGKIGYVDASGNTLYADYYGIGVGRLIWKIPTSETGFYHRKGWFTTDDTQVPFSIPMAFFAMCFLYFFLSLHPMRRRKRKKLGLCMSCGYDLRGSKDVCPECGSEFGGSGADSRSLGDDGP